MIEIIVILPFVAGFLAFALPYTDVRRILLVLVSITHLILTISVYIISPLPIEASLPFEILAGWIVLDSLGYLFLLAISVLFFCSSCYMLGYLSKRNEEQHTPNLSERIFIPFLLCFLSAMSLVVMSYHLGLMWVAIEATTLTSAPLIYFHKSAHSLEATWKYLVICSVGIALALLGTIFLEIASYHDEKTLPLLLPTLLQAAGDGHLNLAWLEVSFLLFLVGYGTKMGLAPLHTWLPDAHSEAPAPISALFSGVLLNCAFLGILRVYQIFLRIGDETFVQNLLLVFGLFSMMIAGVFILRQNDYKRMLAYSSVEHMGILSVGIGLGVAASHYTLFHLVNHSLTKGLLFFTAGNILAVFHTKAIAKVNGSCHIIKISSFLWLAGFFAIVGMPPFSMFISEFNILGESLRQKNYLVAGLYLFFLAVIFIGMARLFFPMVQGPKPTSLEPVKEHWLRVAVPICLLVMILILGVYMPDWFHKMLANSAQQLLGE